MFFQNQSVFLDHLVFRQCNFHTSKVFIPYLRPSSVVYPFQKSQFSSLSHHLRESGMSGVTFTESFNLVLCGSSLSCHDFTMSESKPRLQTPREHFTFWQSGFPQIVRTADWWADLLTCHDPFAVRAFESCKLIHLY